MRQAVFDIRQSEEVREALGDNVEPILGQFVHAGYPRVQGTVSGWLLLTQVAGF